MNTLHINIQHSYSSNNSFTLDINTVIPNRGVTAIFGASGSGKTTLLRCIAGLEKSAGQIQFGESVWQNDTTFLLTHKRPLAYVFQEAILFPHLNVKENLLFAQKRADKNGPSQSLQHLIELFDLQQLLMQKVQSLSGGEKQRVAIARALLVQPKILLMDEPLASLDERRKQDILPFLEKLKNDLNIPIIYVSHSVDEIARLADHIIAIEQGKIISSGAIADVLSDIDLPIKLGHEAGAIIEATIREYDEKWKLCKVDFSGGELWLQDSLHSINEKVRIRILARDISLSLTKNEDSSIVNLLPATVTDISIDKNSPMAMIKINIGQTPLLAKLTRRSIAHLELSIGKNVWAQIKSAALVR